jgi:hypothetical protein
MRRKDRLLGKTAARQARLTQAAFPPLNRLTRSLPQAAARDAKAAGAAGFDPSRRCPLPRLRAGCRGHHGAKNEEPAARDAPRQAAWPMRERFSQTYATTLKTS